MAGIFFGDSNTEIVTNLATTTCVRGSGTNDDCAAQLNECHKQLKHCESHSHDWMYWLGWIIAGGELLLLIFLFTRRKK